VTSSTALLLIVGAVLVMLIANKPVQTWIRRRHEAYREHMYGPDALYDIQPPSSEGPRPASDDDGFDYSIYQ
jgi:hypothetical protein